MSISYKILIISSIFVICTIGFTQDQYIHFLPGSKAVGLGGSMVAVPKDASAIYWNPSALAFYPCKQMVVSSGEPFSFDYAGYSHFIPYLGSVGVALSRLPTGQGTLQAASLAWGQRFSGYKAFGANFNVLNIDQESFVTFGFGFFYRKSTASWMTSFKSTNKFQRYLESLIKKGTLNAGLMIHNIPLDYQPRLHSLRFGMLYETESWGPLLNIAFHCQPGDDSFHLGAGFQFTKQLKVYTGIRNWDEDQFACGLEFTDTNFTGGCSYLVNQKKFCISLSAVLGKNPAQLCNSYIDRGAELLKTGRLRPALAAYEKANAHNIENIKIQYLINLLENKILIQDRSIDSLYTAAMNYQRQEQYVSATLDYLKILELDPEFKKARENLIFIKPRIDFFVDRIFVKAQNFLEQGEYLKALRMFKAILVIRPKHEAAQKYVKIARGKNQEKVKLHYNRGLSYRRQNNLERARQEFARALEYNPEDIETKIQLDAVNATIKRTTKERALRTQFLLEQANKLMRRNKYVDAFQKYHQVLKIDSDNAQARLGVNQTKFRAGRYAQNKFNEGLNALEQNDYFNARKAFNEVTKIASLQPNLRQLNRKAKNNLRQINEKRQRECDRLYELGLQYFNNQQWDEAIAQFEAILTIDPNEERAIAKRKEASRIIGSAKLMEKGKRCYRDGRYLEAMNVFQQVFETQSENSDALDYIRKCQANLNRKVEDHFNRGMAYYTEENFSAALNEWYKVLEINPKHPYTQEYINRAKERLNALNRLP